MIEYEKHTNVQKWSTANINERMKKLLGYLMNLFKLKGIDKKSNGNLQSVKWEDIQQYLPDMIQQSSDTKRESIPVSNPWIQCGLNGIANAAPSIYTAANSGKYLKIIGPPEALAGTFQHMTDKQGNILGGLVDKSGTIRGQTRFEASSASLNATAAAAATFQILSVVTAQYYLHEISTSLKNIEKKLDVLILKMESKQLGEIKGAIETINEIYDGNIRHIESTGDIDWQAPDKVEFWTRIANAETALRANLHALEKEISNGLKKISEKVRNGRKRTKESYNEHRNLLKDLNEFLQSDIVHYYILALQGMMRWYQLVLAFDSHSHEVIKKGRYEQMVKFVKDRNYFFTHLTDEYKFILDRPDGASWKDILKAEVIGAGGSVLISSPFSFFGRFITQTIKDKREASFEADKEAAITVAEDRGSLLFGTSEQFRQLTNSFTKPQKFYLESKKTGIKDELVLMLEKSENCS